MAQNDTLVPWEQAALYAAPQSADDTTVKLWGPDAGEYMDCAGQHAKRV